MCIKVTCSVRCLVVQSFRNLCHFVPTAKPNHARIHTIDHHPNLQISLLLRILIREEPPLHFWPVESASNRRRTTEVEDGEGGTEAYVHWFGSELIKNGYL